MFTCQLCLEGFIEALLKSCQLNLLSTVTVQNLST